MSQERGPCGKISYRTAKEARRSVSHMSDSIRTYVCDVCPKVTIHVTHERYGYSDEQRLARRKAARSAGRERSRTSDRHRSQ